MTKDLTSGNPFKIILLFTLPLMLGNLFQQFYSLADTIIVGRFVSTRALAAAVFAAVYLKGDWLRKRIPEEGL